VSEGKKVIHTHFTQNRKRWIFSWEGK